ncbi:Myosin-11 Myosin XI [Vigna angularis]|uniref:Myosin-11 Myosin XI n=1 Tax=Phaseolus angularis TaxID=3914 RepID=A0A8T0KVF1_PHAAN|nr:Myosin-11 Myosin XI [Vigna angularis]
MGTPVNIIVGSHVWIEDPEVSWIDGQVLKINGKDAEIETTNGKKVNANLSKIYPKDMEAPPGGVDDMTKLSYLHEPGVLQNLKARYELNEIYTYTGNILIAINPFQRLPHIYGAHMMQQYKGAPFGELSPHVFAVADVAYRAMINEKKSNSILVSGESGAGKTETTKMLMQYLAFLGGRAGTEGRTVEQQVLESNPVLEAFGNAKTVRNNNSSFFDMWAMKDSLCFLRTACLKLWINSITKELVSNSPSVNGAVDLEIEKYKLGNPKSFHYLNQSKCYELADVSDAREYLATRRAMDIVGISQKDQEAIFRVVAAILHIGNIEFTKGKDVDSSVPKDDNAKFHLKTTAELLMCDADALEDALCKRVMITPEEVIKRSLDPQSAAVSRDGLAKTIYSRLFDWLVDKINNSIGQDPKSKSLIGVLDIYGFESFKANSLSCSAVSSNFALISQMRNDGFQHVFKMEQEEYTKEEINWSYIEFVDNQDVLDLIEKKPGGIIALLDEACMFPKSTHETFANKLYQTFKNHKRFIKPKLSRTDFTIAHYAGEVLYQSEQFLDKNKDYVVPEHQDLLSASKCSFVSGLFPPLPEETSKSSKFSSIGSRFKGVLEAIRISCAGYPTRRAFFEFINRFGILAPETMEANCDEKTACQKILEKMELKGYQIGKTKIFLRAGQMAELDARRAQVLSNAAKVIQRRVRTHQARRHYLALRKKTIYVQSRWRGRLACKLYEHLRREAAAVKIQKNIRRHEARKAYKELQVAVLTLQRAIRATAARKDFRFRKQTKASIIIQAAKETGALQEAKDKLEKRVEELTWRLQLEKGLKTNLEESKAQEIAKLQNSLQELQIKYEETNALLIKERENVKKVVEEEPPVIKETQVIVEDTQKIETLTAEIESLKTSLESEKQKSDDFERKYNEAQACSEERGKKIEDMEKKGRQLQESLTRLEEKITNLESENQVLRQQAVSMAPNKFLSGRSRSIIQRTESGHIIPEAKTPMTQDNNDVLAYWLSNASTLLLLLQRTLKASGAAGMAPQRRRSSSATLFGRMTQVSIVPFFQSFRGTPAGVNLSLVNGSASRGVDTLRQVEAKYPALLFKQQLTAYVEKIYGMIRDNLKKEISPLLGLCIQAPRTSRASLVKGSSRSVANTEAQRALIAHWQGIVKSLGNFLNTLKANHVIFFYDGSAAHLVMENMSKLVCLNWSIGVIRQQMRCINFALLFSSVLLTTCTNIFDPPKTFQYAGSAWDELKHIRQAIGFLVIHQKPKKTLDEISHDLCPVLSIQQLYRISTMYWDDKYGTHSVSSDVISNMRVLMTEDSNNAVSNSFLLDDDSSYQAYNHMHSAETSLQDYFVVSRGRKPACIPFSVDDISKSMEQIDIADIEPPPLIRENSGFSFLLPRPD